MQLPSHFTVQEVIEKVKAKVDDLNCTYKTLKEEHNKKLEPKYEKTWFGYYKRVEEWEWMVKSYDLFEVGDTLHSWEAGLEALENFPLDAKVKLSVEEINELFVDQKGN